MNYHETMNYKDRLFSEVMSSVRRSSIDQFVIDCWNSPDIAKTTPDVESEPDFPQDDSDDEADLKYINKQVGKKNLFLVSIVL